jgi:hypothetical protein
MDIRQFRSDLAQAFEEAGFERRVIPRAKDPTWLLPGHEVERSFWQHTVRRPWGFLLSGVLSIDVPAFRDWLTKKFPQNQHGIFSGATLLGWHIANDPDMFFGVEEGTPPYEQWIHRIRRRLVVLPDTIEGLLRAEGARAQGLSVFLDAPKAWNYFKAWATGDEPTSPPPFVTPDGQIVDAAANDAFKP